MAKGGLFSIHAGQAISDTWKKDISNPIKSLTHKVGSDIGTFGTRLGKDFQTGVKDAKGILKAKNTTHQIVHVTGIPKATHGKTVHAASGPSPIMEYVVIGAGAVALYFLIKRGRRK